MARPHSPPLAQKKRLVFSFGNIRLYFSGIFRSEEIRFSAGELEGNKAVTFSYLRE
jgi:hypothetical protein